MPPIKIKHIVSFSSEDKNHPADNLLKDEQYRKWKCAANTGERQASVTLQFEKACEIHSIDIGNEGSAFIEILVKRSENKNHDFQVLVVASMFMNPGESKSASNLNRVRMFTRDGMNQTVCKEKWDLVKIVCGQPFNKSLQYGISFVKFLSPPTGETSTATTPTVNQKQSTLQLGAFSLKADDNEAIRPGSLFASLKEKKESPSLTGAAAIRAASAKAEANILKNPSQLETKVVKRGTESAEKKRVRLSPERKTVPSSTSVRANSTSKTNFTPPQRTNQVKINTPSSETRKTPKKTIVDLPTSATKAKVNPAKRARTESPAAVCFEKILDGVVFALSGFQNPFRSNLRDKALEMGAKYRPDWDKTCTHLICAFVNTPKFIQVQGSCGRIAAKEWILDCHKKKQKLSWKLYRMSDVGSPGNGSDNDDVIISDDENKSPSMPKSVDSADSGDMPADDTQPTLPISDDSSDTEDELKRVMERNDLKNEDSDDAYNADTDVEDENGATPSTSNGAGFTNHQQSTLAELPDFFTGCNFLLYGDFQAAMRRLLHRYITAFNGKMEDYMSESVGYVVTQADWDEKFDEALEENSNLVFVKPQWIFACSDKGKVVPHQPYVIVPMAS